MDPHNSPKDTLYAQADQAVDNGQNDPVIARQMERMLWTASDWAKVQNLTDRCRHLEEKAASAKGDQMGATQELRDAVRDVHDEYMDVLVAARAVVKDPSIRVTLELDDPRRNHRDLPAWAGQADRFFGNALNDPETWAVLSDLGFERDRLESLRTSLQEVTSINVTQEDNKGAYQEVSQELQQTRQKLRRCLSDLYTRARRALRNHPQKLEKLGVTAETILDA